MNSIVNHMGKYDHRQHVLSDWLAELEQRFQLGEVNTDKAKITWCQHLIGATGSSILAGLEDDASWETAKETLLSRLGVGSVRDEAWAALKQLKRGSKEIVELAGEAEKLAKRLHPRDEEAAERHAIDAFLGAINRSLAAEVQKLGCRTMEEVVAAARRIERILGRAARLQDRTTNPVDARPNPNPHKGLEKRTRANGVPIDGRYPYRCACCPTSRDSGYCSATPCRLTACHGHCSPASLPTCPSNVSGLRGRGLIFSASTPTAR